MKELFIGLMSGTSVDGIDAAVVDFSEAYPAVVATHYTPYAAELKNQILSLCQPGDNEIERLGQLDVLLGKEFATAVKQLLNHASLSPQAITAIGSHGQTIRHAPHNNHRFTLQIADPNTIAAETGITTVADFRRKDIALGGQGAPLVPAFHQHVFTRTDKNRAIVNIGGIANVTMLPQHQQDNIIGFDLGPGNVLLDAWIKLHQDKQHDPQGEWGAQGSVQTDLLSQFLSDNFFKLSPPKSTGREHFNLAWLNQHLQHKKIAAVDVQATLVEMTARSIIEPIRHHFSSGEILVCGGGAHNAYLMSRLSALAQPQCSVASTQLYGLDPDWIEAMAFAWLARQTINRQPGNLPGVTGATKTAVLGGIYYGV